MCWPTSTAPAPPTDLPRRSMDDWNTCAARPSGSATSPTTSHDRSSRPADSDPTYTLDPDEPDNPQLVYSASIQSEDARDGGSQYTQSINPVPVPGYSGFERIPGLLIGPDALERWGLDVDTDPISYYLLTPYGARPTEETVREALPPD